MLRHFVRAVIFLVALGLLGAGACIVKTKPGRGDHRHHVQKKRDGKHKKHRKHNKHKKHKKQKKHKKHKRDR